MIAAALGVTTEVKLRLSNFSDLTKCFQNRQTMPINFHLLAHKLTKAKAVTDQLALQKDKVLQLGLFRHQDADTRLRALVRDVDPAMFGHAPALSQAMQGVHGDAAFEHRLTLLKLAAFDPEVLAAIHGPHFARASKHHGFNREGWRQALEQVWSHYLPGARKDGFHEQVATMAMHCGDWALARRVIQAGIQVRGQNASDLAQLAWCDARTGQLKRSAEIISDALALDPSHVMAREVQQRTEDRLAHWDDRWRQPVEHVELPLVLEPLDLSHAEAMLYQYRDPQIAIMTGLPAITALEAMQQWITEQIQQRQWAHFAIMHADQGFVGYINLAVSEHAAFFCFWTGVDFQGRGLATQAGKLACEFARKLGVSVMLTSAYSDNQRSIRSLERIGFTQIPIRALPPDQERIFYALADPSLSATDAIDELRNYYLREKIALEFPAPENHGRHESSGD
jgi:RimJ/RimL family protein N-acetyltransferase